MRRLLAFAFLAVILADLGDVSCDPLVAPTDDPEPCSIVCVADCFCCASKIASEPTADLRESGCAEPASVSRIGHPSAGVRPAPYHPPELALIPD